MGYNALSLHKNKIYLEKILSTNIYDILFINETWLNKSKNFTLENQKYSILRGDDGAIAARGVAILYKSTFQVFSDNILPKHLRNHPNVAISKILLENTGKHLFLFTPCK